MTDETRTETPEDQGQATATAPEGEAGEQKFTKLTQNVEMRDIGPCKKHIKVTVERDAIQERLNEQFKKLVGDAAVPGFRPGKAPRRIIERRFQKEVTDQVKGEVMLASLEQLAEEHDIAPLSPPNLDPSRIEIPKEGPMVYEFDVEVRPHFDLPQYTGLKLRRPVRTFSDEDVVEEERRLLAPYGQLVPKPEGNAQLGDYIVADVNVKDGDRTLGELKEVRFRVERQLAFKDGVASKFAEQIRGANPGDKRTVDITLSGGAADQALAGKTVQAAFDVKDVKAIRMPELTHEFLHEFGVHTPEQLRERVRVLLQNRLEYAQRQSARGQVLEKIAAAATWELPQDLLARQARTAMGRRIMEMRASGMNDQEIQGRLRLLQQDVLQSTALALKEHFVLQKIAEVEKIDVSEDDVNDEIERIALTSNESPRRIRARLEKEDLLEALAIELIERKVLDKILDSAEYEDVPFDQQAAAPNVATVEEQAVPGEMQDPAAAAEAQAQAGEAAGTGQGS